MNNNTNQPPTNANGPADRSSDTGATFDAATGEVRDNRGLVIAVIETIEPLEPPIKEPQR